MIRIYFVVILSLLSFSIQAQKKKSKLSIFQKEEIYGVKSGRRTIIKPAFSEIRLEDNGLIAVKDTVGKWGYFDGKGNTIISPRFIETLPFYNNQAMVKKEDGWGIINQEGRFLLKPFYKKIEKQERNVFKVQPFHDVIVFNAAKDTVTIFLTDSVTKLSDELYAYFLDGKCGIVDTAGNKFSLPLYDSIGKYKGLNAIAIQENKWGVINNYGQEILSTYYDSAVIDSTELIRTKIIEGGEEKWFMFSDKGLQLTTSPYSFIDKTNSESIFIFKKDKAFGLMDIEGKEIQSPVFQDFKRVRNGYLLRTKDGEGLLNLTGEWAYLPFADSIKVLSDNYVIYSINSVNHLLDPDGREAFCSRNQLLPLQEELVITIDKGKFGRVDFNGKEILAPVYDSISSLGKDSVLIVFSDNQIGLYNFYRDSLIGPNNRIQEIFPLSEGFYGVKINGKYGFVDGLGRIRIANRYDGIGRFIEGMAPVKLLGRWGYIDKAEKLRIQPLFDGVSDFKDGIAIVKKDGLYGLIDKKGSLVTPFKYDEIERTKEGYFISKKKNSRNEVLKGVISPEGRERIFAKYDELKINSDGNAIVKKFDKYGVVNLNDLILLSFVFDKIEYDEYSKNYITIRQKPAAVVTIPVE